MSDAAKPAARKYDSFAAFYPFYLSEHSDRTCRRLHFAGSSLALLCFVALIVTRNSWWLLAGLVWMVRRPPTIPRPSLSTGQRLTLVALAIGVPGLFLVQLGSPVPRQAKAEPEPAPA